jgi:endonuclease/exonuclease/phosphatase family metal-dependent hydrolase
MKKSAPILLAFGILLLFFIQAAGTLVESIYIMDLMNTSLDEKALGVLFFFVPLLFLPCYRKYPRGTAWAAFAVLFAARGLLPYLGTANRILAAGLGVGAALGLFLLLLAAQPKGEPRSQAGWWGAAGLGLAVALSTLLRAVGDGIEYSLTPAGGWVGWLLGLLLAGSLTRMEPGDWKGGQKAKGVTPALTGFILVLTLAWFAFSAPAVIACWMEGNYILIVAAVSLFACGWICISLARPRWLDRIGRRGLLLWNILFTLALAGLLLAQRVPYPPAPDSAPVVVTAPGWLAQTLLILMLLLFPVIFLDARLFLDQVRRAAPRPRDLVPGFLLGAFALILLVFIHIFTNVWGYVEPVSTPFRGQFYLPYLLLAGLVTVFVWRARQPEPEAGDETNGSFQWGWAVLLAAIFLATVIAAWPGPRVRADAADRNSLVVMTFNTQQSNDDSAEKSFEQQLALIRRVSPDVLALQESDSTRISLNNNDYVRYFAEKLGYYSYFGPTTVTGTYGTAILSRFPLLNTRTVFTYSNQDEIGTTEAEIEVGGRRFTIYNVHPDGSDTAMLVFAQTLLARSQGKPYVIALGDYNLRDNEAAYQLVASVYTNAWVSVYPSKISADGVDMSGRNRIDHIFISPALGVRNPVYVLPPESATDHPVHWAEIYWENP